MKKKLLSVAAFLTAVVSYAQVPGEDTFIHPEMESNKVREEIRIPNIDGYVTLKGDFHIHTAFSDGSVWPDIRVDEAWWHGLDVIAITDHIECRPKIEYFSNKVDHNTAYNIANESKGNRDLIVIHGVEITREKPFGHMNALFIEDGNKADVKDQLDALEAMLKQGAYIIWNHPGWPDDKSTMYDIHKDLIKKGKIHGVELANDIETYPIAYDWVEEYGLHPFSNSDIHGLVEARFGSRRPITLVFAKEKTLEGVKEAMFAGRTLAFFNNLLIGKQELIAPLVDACLDFQVRKENESYMIYNVTNNSDVKFRMQVGDTMHIVEVLPGDTVYMEVGKGQKVTFLNCILGKDRYYSVNQSEL